MDVRDICHHSFRCSLLIRPKSARMTPRRRLSEAWSCRAFCSISSPWVALASSPLRQCFGTPFRASVERRGEERRNDSVGHLQRTFLRRLCCPVGTVSTRPVDPLTAAKIWGNLGTSVRPLVVVCPNHFATTTAREDDDVPWFGRRNEYYKLLSFAIFNIPIACPYCRASDSGRRVTGVPCRSLRPC